jgi:branched-chain amino acid transport system permease protein
VTTLLQQLINGLTVGSLYALMALGLTMVYGVMRVLHIAHAGVFTLGAYGAR